MGISLGDIGSFATGVVDADTKATAERLVDRRAELAADRQFYIDMKTKKYESELKSFEAEDAKYKAIQSVKSKVGEGASKSDFGAAFLQETNPTLLYQMQKDFQDNPSALQKQLSLYANADFKTTTTRDSLDTKLKQDVDSITANYKTQLENARGDSKLINAILGKRDKKIADTIQENEDSKNGVIKAKEIAIETDTANKAYEYGDEKAIEFRVPKKFKEKVEPLRIKLNDNTEIKKENVNINLTFFSENDIAVPAQFLTKDTDGNTTGLKGPGNTFVNQTNSLANQAVKTLTNESLYASTGGDSSLISNDFNPNAINGMVSDRLANYSVVSSDKKDGFFSNRNNIIAIVPFSIVDNNNTLGGYQFSNKAQTKKVGEAYLQALKNIDATNNPMGEGNIERSQKYLNDFQNKLLRTEPGNQTKEVKAVQNEMVRILTEQGIIKVDGDKGTSGEIEGAVGIEGENLTGDINQIIDTDVKSIVIDGQNIPLTEENKKALDAQGIKYNEPIPLVPQETDEGYDPEYNTAKDRSITAGTIRRLKRGVTLPMTQEERLEARRIQAEARKKQKELLQNKKRNESLKLPEVTPLTSE